MLAQDFLPMEPVPWPEPFDDPDWLFQPKWDGVRLLALVEGKEVRLWTRRGYGRTAQYPEIAEALRNGFRGTSAVFDGEAVVFWEGKPSFARVLRRERALRPVTVTALRRSLPATYMVFDLLYLDGRDVRGMALEERQELLAEGLAGGDGVFLTESFSRGRVLFEAVRERGWEGIVAKRRRSRYHPGRSAAWRKIKARRRQLCAVAGFTVTGRGIGALLLGAYRDDEFIYVGRVATGIGEEVRRILEAHLSAAVRPDCPFSFAPRLGGQAVRWLHPQLTVLVEFAEWTEGLQMRQPVLVRFTSDPVAACRLP